MSRRDQSHWAGGLQQQCCEAHNRQATATGRIRQQDDRIAASSPGTAAGSEPLIADCNTTTTIILLHTIDRSRRPTDSQSDGEWDLVSQPKDSRVRFSGDSILVTDFEKYRCYFRFWLDVALSQWAERNAVYCHLMRTRWADSKYRDLLAKLWRKSPSVITS